MYESSRWVIIGVTLTKVQNTWKVKAQVMNCLSCLPNPAYPAKILTQTHASSNSTLTCKYSRNMSMRTTTKNNHHLLTNALKAGLCAVISYMQHPIRDRVEEWRFNKEYWYKTNTNFKRHKPYLGTKCLTYIHKEYLREALGTCNLESLQPVST